MTTPSLEKEKKKGMLCSPKVVVSKSHDGMQDSEVSEDPRKDGKKAKKPMELNR